MMKKMALMIPLLLLSACSITTEADRINAKLPSLSAEELLKEGNGRLEVKQYVQARQYFKFLFENFPNSPQAVQALLKMADAFSRQGGLENLLEARQRYVDFFSRFPQASEAENALYMQGRISLDLKENPTRDPINTRMALQTLSRYLQIYPTGAHAAQAREGIRACTDQLASHELDVARFYFKRKSYRATLGRLEFIVKSYPDYSRMGEVHRLFAQVYRVLGDESTAEEYSRKASQAEGMPKNP